MYLIVTEGQEDKVSDTSATIGNLQPGTNYTFKIYSEADDGETRSDPESTSIYTSESEHFLYKMQAFIVCVCRCIFLKKNQDIVQWGMYLLILQNNL